MSDMVKILGIAGSLRQNSYNRAALGAASKLLPAGAQLDTFDLSGIPMFDQDDKGKLPDTVAALKSRIRQADALLFVTPEYNYSISGVLKNAIDWGSRPYGDNAWFGKPAAIMGASVSSIGTARAQYHLRQVFVSLNLFVLNQPEVMINEAAKRFDSQGNITDDKTKDLIRQLLQGLVGLSARMKTAELRRAN